SVGSWTNITQVSAGNYHTVGLKSDGTVVAVGQNGQGQCDVGAWTNVTQVSAGWQHTVGLGSVVAVGDNGYGQCNLFDWRLLLPTVNTTAASGITTDSATLNMSYTVEAYSPVDIRFGYKKSIDSPWSYTPWASKSASGTHAETLTGLNSSTQYDFKAQLQYNSTVIEGNTLQFITSITSPAPRASQSPPQTPQLPPADIQLNGVTVSSSETQPGQPVTVLASLVNNGTSSGSYNVALRINGRVEQQRTVEVSPGTAYPVKFTVMKTEPGTYDVAIEGQRASFTVVGSTSGAPAGSGLIILIALAILILATAVVLMVTFRRTA
ncbi:hypothetical protein ACFLTN_05950, partial [Chloroflexota bacterium]